MKVLVFSLLLSSLMPDSVFSQLSYNPYNDFLLQHTYSSSTPVDCTRFMNPVLQQLHRTDCKTCNTIILGDYGGATSINDVLNVCRGAGKRVRGNLYQSFKNFSYIKCYWIVQPGVYPPNCQYTAQYYSSQITIACNNGLPVHFQC